MCKGERSKVKKVVKYCINTFEKVYPIFEVNNYNAIFLLEVVPDVPVHEDGRDGQRLLRFSVLEVVKRLDQSRRQNQSWSHSST